MNKVLYIGKIDILDGELDKNSTCRKQSTGYPCILSLVVLE